MWPILYLIQSVRRLVEYVRNPHPRQPPIPVPLVKTDCDRTCKLYNQYVQYVLALHADDESEGCQATKEKLLQPTKRFDDSDRR